MAATTREGAERLQKVLAELGLASRRQAEGWIRAGRLSVNGKAAVLGMRVSAQDQLRLDGRLIRRRAHPSATVWLCHRSPGEALLPHLARDPASAAGAAGAGVAGVRGSDTGGTGTASLGSAAAANAVGAPGRVAGLSFAERLPRRSGRRFVSISPLPMVDGGLELLTADGALAARLQRAVRALEVEFSLRIRGELSAGQQQAILGGQLDSGATVQVRVLAPAGGQGANRWYRLVALGASGSEIRQLLGRHAVTTTRSLRIRVGSLQLPPTLARGRWRALTAAELSALLDNPATVP